MKNEILQFSQDDVSNIGMAGIGSGFTMFLTEHATKEVVKTFPENPGGNLLELVANFDLRNLSILTAHLFREADPVQKGIIAGIVSLACYALVEFSTPKSSR